MMTTIEAAVLYVEDDLIVRESAANALEDAGFEVVVAENGDAALAALKNDADPFCAIITDVNLGTGPDGWEVAKRARELNRALPVVYVSGASGHEWRSKGVPNSVLIAKPFAPSQIVVALSSLVKTAT